MKITVKKSFLEVTANANQSEDTGSVKTKHHRFLFAPLSLSTCSRQFRNFPFESRHGCQQPIKSRYQTTRTCKYHVQSVNSQSNCDITKVNKRYVPSQIGGIMNFLEISMNTPGVWGGGIQVSFFSNNNDLAKLLLFLACNCEHFYD